jgi:hypothetical protein
MSRWEKFRCKVLHWHGWIVPIVEYNPETKKHDKVLAYACMSCFHEFKGRR